MPTPFLDIAFPLDIARGATGGPGFSTGVVLLGSGNENRNRNWAKARGHWDISTGIKTRAQMDEVIAHFYVVAGKAHSFRFRDWSDYRASEQAMVSVSSTVFQLVKRYVRGPHEYLRSITKPLAGSVTVKDSGVPVVPAAIHHATGLVTFSSAPAATPTASFTFDVAARFDTDRLPVQVNLHDQMEVPQIDLIEVRE